LLRGIKDRIIIRLPISQVQRKNARCAQLAQCSSNLFRAKQLQHRTDSHVAEELATETALA
jgi:hypothetical protein